MKFSWVHIFLGHPVYSSTIRKCHSHIWNDFSIQCVIVFVWIHHTLNWWKWTYSRKVKTARRTFSFGGVLLLNWTGRTELLIPNEPDNLLCFPWTINLRQRRAEVCWCPGRLLDCMPPTKLLSSSGVPESFLSSQSHKPLESESSKIVSSRITRTVESLVCKLESTSSQTKFHIFSMSFFCYEMASNML